MKRQKLKTILKYIQSHRITRTGVHELKIWADLSYQSEQKIPSRDQKFVEICLYYEACDDQQSQKTFVITLKSYEIDFIGFLIGMQKRTTVNKAVHWSIVYEILILMDWFGILSSVLFCRFCWLSFSLSVLWCFDFILVWVLKSFRLHK